MNPSRPDPLFAGSRQAAPAHYDARSSAPPQQHARQSENGEGLQARAAKFEDEKRRIVESCFAKRDPDGTQIESYITHVRVIEDAMHASAAPPPDSAPANKKSRVIIVAVRKSGRVKVHKARENPSGTFSIGKSWALDELTAVLNYESLAPLTSQMQLEKQWAGDVGFLVTMGKPYYWQAPTAREKAFFIASLIKIYRKYTNGKYPDLLGFSQLEFDTLTGGASGQPTPDLKGSSPPPVQQKTFAPPVMPAASMSRPQSPHGTAVESRDLSRTDAPRRQFAPTRTEYRPPTSDGKPSLARDDYRNSSRSETPKFARDETKSQVAVDTATSRPLPKEAVPSSTTYLQPEGQGRTISARTSHSSLQHGDQISVTSSWKANGVGTPSLAPDVNRRNLNAAVSKESLRDGTSSIATASSRPSTAVSEQKPWDVRLDRTRAQEEPLPEKKRPFLPKVELSSGQVSVHSATTSTFVTPAVTPSLLDHDTKTPPTSDGRAVPSEPNVNQESDYFKTKVPELARKDEVAETLPSPPKASTPPPPPPPVTVDELTAEPEEVSAQKKAEEEHRPGLGPMIKPKSAKDIANQFRRAAMAANAFQPRSGGAGARLKALQEKTSNEPDGITGVVPAPLFRGMSGDSHRSATPDLASPMLEKDKGVVVPSTTNVTPKVHLERVATEDTSQVPDPTPPVESAEKIVRTASPEKARSRSPQRRKRQRQEAETEKYCSSLGVDPRVLEGRGADFNDLLMEFGWDGKLGQGQKIEDFEGEIRRDIGRAQATGWLGHIDQQESKVQELSKAFEKAIEECEELDGLFTLYSHELDTLHADIEYIEAQSQGLQVQTANQKLLQNELQSLLTTLTISPTDLRSLQNGHLDTPDGVAAVEKSLAILYRAMITIDPEIRQNRVRQAEGTAADRSGIGVYADTEIGQMRAVREKKEEYREETLVFLRRFNQHMTSLFKSVEQRNSEDSSRNSALTSTNSLDLKAHHASRQDLWLYNAMMLFVREVNSYEWQTLITSYEMNIKSTYQDHFRDNAMARRRAVRQPTGEEQEALFTTQERDKADDSIAFVAARKLTVKRGKTVRTGTIKHSLGERRDGKPEAWEVFDSVIQQQARVIAEEQNYVVHFFHLSSQSNLDFKEIVSTRTPDRRMLPNLNAKQSYDPDRNMAKIVQQVVDGIYSFWPMDLQNLLEWVLKTDQLQGIGVLCAIEQCLATYEETNQEFLTRTLRALHDRLTGLFHKFVDDQVRAIEETKVKVKKRKGVISFMRTFPLFNVAVETMILDEKTSHDLLEVRFIVNDAYSKILKAMWESLNVIAKDDPAGGTGGGHSTVPTSGDHEDKEALNYHILLIENMNHFIEEVEPHTNVVLEEWTGRANHDLVLHLAQYTNAVIRRPLGKWLDFVESTEALMKNTETYTGISSKPSHSRSAAKRVLTSYDGKEVRKGIETLKKRIEKHFGDVEDPSNLSKSLIQRVNDDCSLRYTQAYDRMQYIIDQVYEGNLEVDWRKEDVVAAFKR